MNIGEKISYLTLIEVLVEDNKKQKRGIFQCDCGNKKDIRISHVVSKNIKWCGKGCQVRKMTFTPPERKAIPQSEFKECNKCRKIFPNNLEFFIKNPTAKDFTHCTCKMCLSYSRPRHWNGDKLYCKKCKQYLMEDRFGPNSKRVHRNYKHIHCLECVKKSKILKTKTSLKNDLERFIKYRTTTNLNHLKHRKKSCFLISPDFDYKYIIELFYKQGGLCAISKIPMTHVRFGENMDYNVSIDRIDSNIGYLKSNIQLVCSVFNKMKGVMSTERFLDLCIKLVNNHENTSK